MAVEMEGLEFQIETKVDEGAKGIEALSKSLGKLKKVLDNIDTSKLEGLGKALESVSRMGELKISASVGTQLGRIGEAMGSITEGDVERLERVSAALNSLSSVGNVSLPRVNVPAEGMVAETTAPVTNTADATSGVTQAVTSAQQVSAAVEQATARTWSFRSVLSGIGGVFSKGFALGASALKKLGNTITKVKTAAANAKSTFSKLKSMLGSQLSARVKQVTGGLGQLFSSLKRIAMYRMIRWALSSIIKGFKEGVNNLYQYSNALGGAFAINMNSAATNALYLKNSLGAMAAPIINSLAPAIDIVTDKIVGLLNLINQLLSVLSGRGTYTAAKKMEKSYGDALGGAGGAAKDAAEELKRFTTGIDELNIIQETPDTSGGGGGGGVDYSSMFEELPIEMSDFATRLKEAFDNADWETLGTLLGGKLNEIIDSVDYSGIGKKIGYGINGAMATVYHFLDTVNFTNIGVHIAELTNAALEEWDTSYWGALIVKKFTIIPDLIIGFLSGLDWKLVGKRLGDFFIGALDEITKWVKKYDWSKMGENLWQGIKDFLSGIDWGRLFTSLINALGAVLDALALFVLNFFIAIGKDIGTWVDTHIVQPMVKGVSNWWDKVSNIDFSLEAAVSLIKKGWTTVKEWIGSIPIISQGISLLKSAWTTVKSWIGALPTISQGISLMKSGWTSIKSWIGTHVIDVGVSLFKNGWSSLSSWIGTSVSVGISLFKSGWTTLKSWFGLANGGIVGANGSVQMFSSGGSIHNGAAEFWNAIPKYAGGTANAHGSMFVAGERGAELVGHVNGRTEVLNRSQLGQVMHRSIVDGMRQFAGYWNAINTHMTTCTNAMISAMLVSADAVYAGMNTSDVVMVQSVGTWMDNLSNRVEAALAGAGSAEQIAEGVREGMYEVTARQNDLLREQNDLLQRLLNKNTIVQIGNKTIKEAVVTQDNADGYRFTK